MTRCGKKRSSDTMGLLDRFIKVDSKTTIIITRKSNSGSPENPEKEPANRYVTADIKLSESNPSAASGLFAPLLNARLKSFIQYLTHPLSFLFFVGLSVISFWSDSRNMLAVGLLVLLTIEWIAIQIQLKKIKALRLEIGNVEAVFASVQKILPRLMLLIGLYGLTAVYIIYLEIAQTIIWLQSLLV
ncbi:MAG: hypothetical protein Q7R47_01455 [Candidatus Diapherotrites archaeon]|nr:hypothetical protein [Candidatus Diapherotrites archaeon]